MFEWKAWQIVNEKCPVMYCIREQNLFQSNSQSRKCNVQIVKFSTKEIVFNMLQTVIAMEKQTIWEQLRERFVCNYCLQMLLILSVCQIHMGDFCMN